MPRRPAAALIALLTAASVVGCGGGRAAPRPTAQADLRLGRTVFVSRCTACHSLGGIGPRRPAGDDLTGYRMTLAQVLRLARNMPPAAGMTERELRAVAAYVAAVQARGGG